MTRSKDFISMKLFFEIDLFGIAYVKVEFIPVLKIYTIPILERFVWSTHLFNVVAAAENALFRNFPQEVQFL